MKVWVMGYRSLVGVTPLMSLRRNRTFAFTSSSDSALKWEGGVSMVQGASRGIGLEFVSFLSSYSSSPYSLYLFHILFYACLNDEVRKEEIMVVL